MLKKLAKLFKEPEQGIVTLKFIALDENDEPYEDVATVPYHDEYVQEVIEYKFKKFMLLRKHLVVEITVQNILKTSG
jgi:hypothetical protein